MNRAAETGRTTALRGPNVAPRGRKSANIGHVKNVPPLHAQCLSERIRRDASLMTLFARQSARTLPWASSPGQVSHSPPSFLRIFIAARSSTRPLKTPRYRVRRPNQWIIARSTAHNNATTGDCSPVARDFKPKTEQSRESLNRLRRSSVALRRLARLATIAIGQRLAGICRIAQFALAAALGLRLAPA